MSCVLEELEQCRDATNLIARHTAAVDEPARLEQSIAMCSISTARHMAAVDGPTPLEQCPPQLRLLSTSRLRWSRVSRWSAVYPLPDISTETATETATAQNVVDYTLATTPHGRRG